MSKGMYDYTCYETDQTMYEPHDVDEMNKKAQDVNYGTFTLGGAIAGGAQTNHFSVVPPYKYSEKHTLAEVGEYIARTYGEHYVGENKVQAFDVYESLAQNSDPSTTHRDMAIKYLMRYGKKGGYNRNDLLKATHYLFMLLHYHSKKHTPLQYTVSNVHISGIGTKIY